MSKIDFDFILNFRTVIAVKLHAILKQAYFDHNHILFRSTMVNHFKSNNINSQTPSIIEIIIIIPFAFMLVMAIFFYFLKKYSKYKQNMNLAINESKTSSAPLIDTNEYHYPSINESTTSSIPSQNPRITTFNFFSYQGTGE